MTRPALILAALAALAGPAITPAAAQVSTASSAGLPPLTGQRAVIARELPKFGYRDVDVRALSSGQVAHIANLVHSKRSRHDIRALIATALEPGPLQRGVDRIFR